MSPLPKSYKVAPQVTKALLSGTPVVALESTVITHGLPYPDNLQLALDMESEVSGHKAIPATIGMLNGRIHVGLSNEELAQLAEGRDMRKISLRDFAPAIAQSASGGTTVAGTLLVAQQAGIKVFATGGIGGVHRQAPFDVSTDLEQLARSPLVLVCAGAKSILDLPATLERLETLGVPVIGYQTDEFPAFYSRESGLPVSARADSPQQVAEMARIHWELGLSSTLLVVAPPPVEAAIPYTEIETFIEQAVEEALAKGIRGQAVTPFLLARLNELSGGRSLQANLALLKNNARLAAEIAAHLYTPRQLQRA